MKNYDNDDILGAINHVDRLICDEDHWGQASPYKGFGDTSLQSSRPLLEQAPGGGERHCPRTALSYFEGYSLALYSGADSYLTRAIASLGKYPAGTTVPAYNNDPARTFAEIKQLIAKARGLRLTDLAALQLQR